jgi:hypothetical protein
MLAPSALAPRSSEYTQKIYAESIPTLYMKERPFAQRRIVCCRCVLTLHQILRWLPHDQAHGISRAFPSVEDFDCLFHPHTHDLHMG